MLLPAKIPKISVIIPVYNCERYLEQTLSSVVNQSLGDLEIICIDDNSSDKSLKIINSYKSRDNRINVIALNSNCGAGAARNVGLAAAKGEYLVFFDADDCMEPDMLLKMYNAASCAKADIAICCFYIFDSSVNVKRKPVFNHSSLGAKRIFSRSDIPGYIFALFGNNVWNRIYRREFIMRNNIRFQEIYRANDLYFCIVSMALAERITFVDKYLLTYRAWRKNSAQSSVYKYPLDFYKALLAAKERLKREDLFVLLEPGFTSLATDIFAYNLRINRKPELMYICAYKKICSLIKKETAAQKRGGKDSLLRAYSPDAKAYINYSVQNCTKTILRLFCELLFSVTNSGNFKIIRFFGFKFSLNRKRRI